MSRRRRLEPPPDPPEVVDSEELDSERPDEEDVEYFEELPEESWVWTSVPKSAQESQTSSSAPSILTVLGVDVSVPHISH
ncbi:hypothetical protein C497_05822 [Halalkalicoccus jeotgali B3]|uniref:Uncharacterized protein n=1 Tax=Halalkalicoccus jeotgali (strain DSM 18796 / CECT 7217 / JCM 14584 / KCTC 4019 / B3) TaxID=795797 RepID=D8J2B1_HALJB|nr:hypothetical protein HacjB3_07415 [Halalkalicoccus jeotgali B3]ELY39450.1 hypothetical protein C497_05822 [Halalkalicoccus jeotgali B3]